MNIVSVYLLIDPRDALVRYVGSTVDPQKRHRQHRADSGMRGESHKARWLRQLRDSNLKPIFYVVETAPLTQRQDLEAIWVSRWRELGADLVNATANGEGGGWQTGLTKETDNRIARMAATKRGRPTWGQGLTKETDVRIARISQAMKDRNIVPWSKGLNAKTDPRVARAVNAMARANVGRRNWSQGLNTSDERVKRATEAMRASNLGKTPWNKGLTKETDPRLMELSKMHQGRCFRSRT